MKFKNVFMFGIIFIFMLGIVNALPYNVNVSNSNVKFFQYFDNETLGNNPPIWIAIDSFINNTIVNGTGYSTYINYGDNKATLNIEDTTGDFTSGIYTYEFDLYMVDIGGEQLYIYAGGVLDDRKYLNFYFGHPAVCSDNSWGVWASGSFCLEPNHYLVIGEWEHIQIEVNADTNTSRIRFYNYNNSTLTDWSNVTESIDIVSYNESIKFTSSSSSYYIDNVIIYSGTEIPELPECVNDNDCSLCEKCSDNECVFQTISEDIKDECAENSTCIDNFNLSVFTGNCNNEGSCYEENFVPNICEYCNINQIINQSYGDDLFNDCSEFCDGTGYCYINETEIIPEPQETTLNGWYRLFSNDAFIWLIIIFLVGIGVYVTINRQ